MGDFRHSDAQKKHWLSMRVEYSSGDPIYVGKHPLINATQAETGWSIWKLTWTSGDMTYRQGPLHGSWTGRAALGWT